MIQAEVTLNEIVGYVIFYSYIASRKIVTDGSRKGVVLELRSRFLGLDSIDADFTITSALVLL